MAATEPGPGWSLYEIASRDDPHAAWRAIREDSPVLDAGDGVYFVTRWDLVDGILRDARHGAGRGVAASFGATEGLAFDAMRVWLMSLDGPDHRRARGLVRREFTPRRVEALRPFVEATTASLVAGIEARAHAGEPIDLIASLAAPLPSEVIRSLFGIAPDAWQTEVLPRVHDSAGGLDMIEGLARHFDALLEHDRIPDGLLAQLCVPDPELGALSRLEVVANAVLLVTAAIDTTAGLIGNAISCLLDRPEIVKAVRSEPARLDGVVEETLRYEPSALSCTRTAGCDLVLEGVPIARGSQLLLGLAAANRDPERYAEPDRFDPERALPGLLSFGGGRHHCLGAALARMEARVALERLIVGSGLDLERVEPARWQTRNPTVRALERLPVRATRRGGAAPASTGEHRPMTDEGRTMRVEDHSLMDPAVQESPFAYYRALLEQAPVYLMPEIGAYVVSRYRDVQHVLAHPEIWSNDLLGKAGFSMFQHREAQDVLEAGGWPRDTKLQTDPPIHRDYRALVAPAFTAGRVRALEPFVRATAEALAEDLAREGECEFIATFAAWLPIRVITRLLGLPAEDAARIKHWSDAWVEPLSGVISKEREIEVAHLGVELQQYLAAWMEEKRESPAEDVLSELAVACFPDGRPLPMAEKMGIAEHLIVGGHETATSALASGVMLLAQQPEVARALREDPGLVRNFVEEVLRLESPSQGFFRFALETAEVAGVEIPKGSMVQVRFAAANRDPAQFPDPDRLDLHRPNAGAHMAFSQGEHHCVGAPLARLELQTAFRVLLDRFERIEIPEGSVLTHLPGLALRTLSALPIRVA